MLPGAASARASAKRARPRVVVGEPLDVVVEGVQARRREDADLPHAAAEPLAPDARLGHLLGRADEHRPDRRAEALGQADADGVELPAVVGERDARGDVGVPEPRAVEVHRDAAVAGGLHAAPRSGSSGCTVPPPKLWVFSTTTSAVLDLVGADRR